MWTWMVAMAMAAPMDLDWVVVNDTVMGGVSSGAVEVGETVRFTGVLSLDNNGGFASIRSVPTDLELEGVRALRLLVRGDGRTYDLTARRADVNIRAGSYRVPISTAPEPVTIEVPLSAFRPRSFGRPVAGAPALDSDPGRIDSLGFLLGDKQPGPFALEILDITPIPGAPPRGDGHDAVLQSLTQAVSVGVPAFNGGDAARCRDVYTEALRPLVEHEALTAGERSVVREALQAAGSRGPDEGAWTLRAAIDTVLAGAR
jgi:monofunctional biosynthetic peptidoglycan transglycosylase